MARRETPAVISTFDLGYLKLFNRPKQTLILLKTGLEGRTNNKMAADIAVVSFERFLSGNETDRRQVASEVYKAFSTVGWVYIKDHGIPQNDIDGVFMLVSHSPPRVSHQLIR